MNISSELWQLVLSNLLCIQFPLHRNEIAEIWPEVIFHFFQKVQLNEKKHEENPFVIELLLLVQIAKRNFQGYQFTKKCGDFLVSGNATS